jgi:MoaA/NifB/PqqE/SkfB family radical SAM enzyme
MQKQKTEDKLIMDGNKLMWHPERLAAFLRGDRIAPLHIDMGLTTGCNMDCTYCYGVIQGRTSVAKRFDLNKDVINRFLIDAKELGVRSIAFIGEGENTLNPALYDALETARQIKLDVSLATNGILLPEERMPLMLSSLSWIRFNISAANPAVFEQIHRVKQYEKVLSNIRALVQAKKDLSSRTVIGLQMVVMDENVDQIVPLAKLGQELGVDYFVVKSCSDTYQKFLESPIEKYGEISHILQEAESYSTETYSVIVKWNKITNKGLKDYKTCYGTQFILQMSGD